MNFIRRATWQDDENCTRCNVCKNEFDMVSVRKHHCRLCGLVVCNDCSQHQLIVPEDDLVIRPKPYWQQLLNVSMEDADDFRMPQRACNACEEKLAPLQPQLKAEVSRCNQETVVDSDSQSILLPQMNFFLENEIRNAALMVNRMANSSTEENIPKDMLDMCRGVAFLTVLKVGFGFSGRYGTGLVISRLPDDTWSAPSAITLSGVGWGLQMGGELTDVMLVLSTDGAVETFKSRGQVTLGAELGLSAGPYGRSLETDVTAGNKGAAHAFSYAHSQGLFFGASLEACAITQRKDVNKAFYGETIGASKLLAGDHPRPRGAEPLYKALDYILYSGQVPFDVTENRVKEYSTVESSLLLLPSQVNDEDRVVDNGNLNRDDSYSFADNEFDDPVGGGK
jgi:SH3 domain-containing YSC84-like protein 1